MADELVLDQDDDDFKNIDTTPPATKKPVPSAHDATVSEAQKKMVKIILEDNDNIPPNGLFLGHNGTGYLLQSGVEVQVPVFLLDVLNHAVESVTQVDPITKQPTGTREKLRFPYRLVAA